MKTQSTLRKVIAAAAISAAIGLTSLAAGAASADGPTSTRESNFYSVELVSHSLAGTGVRQGTLAAAPAKPQAAQEREHIGLFRLVGDADGD